MLMSSVSRTIAFAFVFAIAMLGISIGMVKTHNEFLSEVAIYVNSPGIDLARELDTIGEFPDLAPLLAGLGIPWFILGSIIWTSIEVFSARPQAEN
jgi:hypothetical protein